jgi:Ca2+-binding EF-hand superfamily protein
MATKKEMTTMMEWGTPSDPKPAPIDERLKADQIAELQEIFHIYDTDKDAHLSLAELVDALTS